MIAAGRHGEPTVEERPKVDNPADESVTTGGTSPGAKAQGRPISRSMIGLGFDFAGSFVGFVFVGFWVGRYYGSEKWGVVIGSALGLIGGFYNLLRQALRQAPRDDEPGD